MSVRNFSVSIVMRLEVDATVLVEARTEEEAERAVREMIQEGDFQLTCAEAGPGFKVQSAEPTGWVVNAIPVTVING